MHEQLENLVDKARAAIAKAKGGMKMELIGFWPNFLFSFLVSYSIGMTFVVIRLLRG